MAIGFAKRKRIQLGYLLNPAAGLFIVLFFLAFIVKMLAFACGYY